MSALQKKLDEQRKIIEFLASKYEKDTGRRVELPTTIGQLLGDDSIIEETFTSKRKGEEDKHDPYSFAEAVELMRLPKSDQTGGKKGQGASNKKKEIKMNSEHMSLERIDLSGFRMKRFSRSGFRELIEGI